jgi:hypothetical protein
MPEPSRIALLPFLGVRREKWLSSVNAFIAGKWEELHVQVVMVTAVKARH